MHRFIVIEGIDGAGKTDVSKCVGESLGAVVMATPAPPYSDIREALDDALKENLVARHLFYLSSVAFASGQIMKLRETKDVICVRWVYTTEAFHLAAGSPVRIDVAALELQKPTHAFLLTISDEKERIRRVSKRGVSLHDQLLQRDKELRHRYLELLNQYSFCTIDTTMRTQKEIADEILKIILKSEVDR